MKKLAIILCVLAAIAALLYVGANVLLGRAISVVAEQAIAQAAKRGVVGTFEHGGARITSLSAFTLRNVHGSALSDDAETQHLISADTITVHVADRKTGAGTVSLTGLSAERTRGADRTAISGSLTGTLPGDPSGPVTALRNAADALQQMRQTGVSALPIRFEGLIHYTLEGREMRIAAGAAPDADGSSALRLNEADLRRAIASADPEADLTDAEVSIVAAHPMALPDLMTAQTSANTDSRAAAEKDSTVPEDAYRHVLWSFRMTRSVGAELAKAVGDAHEEGDTGNTPAERAMDLQNNAIGRGYATGGVSEQDLLRRVRTDPKIILSAE